jgi:hypothetical protein
MMVQQAPRAEPDDPRGRRRSVMPMSVRLAASVLDAPNAGMNA